MSPHSHGTLFLATDIGGITYSSNEFDTTSQEIPRFNHGRYSKLALVTLLLTSRRGRTACALATTLAAGSLTFAACSPDRAGNLDAEEQPTRVASATRAQPTDAATSAADSFTMRHTASRETTLTARAFMGYLDEEQRTRILSEGLDLSKLTRAQQITVLKVLESMLNEDAYDTVSSLLNHITTTPGMEPHYLRFSAAPEVDSQWKLVLSGPKLGLNALLSEDENIIFESAHFALSSDDVQAIVDSTTVDEGKSPMTTAQVAAEELLSSLTPQQRQSLAGLAVTDGGGLKGSDLDDSQRRMLIDVTTNWIHLGNESAVISKQEKIVDTLDETYFSLSNTPALTFQVKGPEIFIEFKETPTGDGQAVIQSVFEDPSLTTQRVH